MSHGRSAGRGRGARAGGIALAAGLLVATVLGAPGPGASAITPEAERTWETAVVERVSDGDTVRVRIMSATNPEMYAPAEGQTYCRNRITATGALPDGGLKGCLVRLIAIQAAETAGHGSTGLPQCGAEQAKAALAKALPVGTVVQLRSINVGSGDPTYSGGRLARSVYAPDGAGGWVDVARALYRTGLFMWFPFNTGDTEKAEYAHNLSTAGWPTRRPAPSADCGQTTSAGPHPRWPFGCGWCPTRPEPRTALGRPWSSSTTPPPQRTSAGGRCEIRR